MVEELLMDGTVEQKAFAPGYGEFQARAEDELATVGLALPIDGAAGRPPAALDALAAAVRTHDPAAVRRAAPAAEQASLDLQLRHRPPAEVDLDRLDL
jgi:hypothetical protein